ncbi:MAG TPA: RNA polymerase sigma-70 factor [Porphyromonadaceae bacterium]|nr:RNA polymerase sigma-70 factor [Porphyromonadaceae bacterium]
MEKHINNAEQSLIQALKQGSHKAFDRIYQMYSKRLYAYSLQFTKSPEEAEDIVQDVFVKIWTNRDHIRQNETLRSLLFIMAKHHLINAYRSRLNHPVYEEYVKYTETLSADDAHYNLEYNEFAQYVRSTIRTLPPTQQKVIVLSRMQQLSNKEIAEKLSLSKQTVKNQLSLGLKSLKDKLGEVSFILTLLLIN